MAHLMKNKGDKNETLSLFFNRHGVTTKMVMYGSKEHIFGYFRKKSQEAYCDIKYTEQYSLWKLQAEVTIEDLMKGADRKMVINGTPKVIWNNALEFEAYVISHTDLDVYILHIEVPETLMSSGNSDISQLC